MCAYEEGDALLCLPCSHALHEECGTKWLLGYSKRCPICKRYVC